MQDRHFHMPIQSWTLVPKETVNQSMLFIETANFELKVEIDVSFIFI
jgi:hypothetical protein